MAKTDTKPESKRLDPRAAATQAALIEAAESLFAENGIEGVSMRQIGQAIGSANTNVVAYHFGGKDELVAAVIRHRLPALEARRRELLGDHADSSLHDLLDILYRPFLEQTNREGKHSYVAFLASLFRANRFAIRMAVSSEYPTTEEVMRRIRAHIPHLSEELSNVRFLILTNAMFTTLHFIDQTDASKAQADMLFGDCLRTLVAMLQAPGP